MDIFSVLTLLGGLALFLYGMNTMGDGLAKVAGGKLEQILEKLTSTPIKGVLLGALVTAVIQSSSATTVMVVGFVNSGIMKLSQAVGIIMGANIGTTATSWILSLAGIESSNVWIKMLKPSSFAPILAVIGAVMLMFSKKEKKHDIGKIFLGFAVLMFGMESMSDAVAPLADVPEFTNLLLMFSNPILGMLAGAVLTAVIQSSSASVGILQALCSTGAVTFGSALPIIMGQNIGTCVTALISAIGAKKNAKRAAFVHLYFNIIGTVIFMIVFYILHAIINFGFVTTAANAAGIAVIHSCFNVAATLILLPFGRVLEKLATITVRDVEEEVPENALLEDLKVLDERFLETPAYAVAQSHVVTAKMATLSRDAVGKALELLWQYDEAKAEEVLLLEDTVDKYSDALENYLLKTSNKNLSEKDNQTVSLLLHCIGDWERISDRATNILEIAQLMKKKEMLFSDKALGELSVYGRALKEIMNLAEKAFVADDMDLAFRIEPLEEVIDHLHKEIKSNHIRRLRKGKCTVDVGIVLEDLITNLERIADHCSNMAVCMIQGGETTREFHDYAKKIENSQEFIVLYDEYTKKYVI